MKLEIKKIGNSTGLILPKELLAHLHVEVGESVSVTRTPNGIELRSPDVDFEAQMEVAREVIVMAEADKLGRRMPNLELPWSSVQTLITDERLSDEACAQIEARGVKVIRAR